MTIYSESEGESESSVNESSSSQKKPAAAMVSPSCSAIIASFPLSPFRRESIAVSDTGTEVTLRDGKEDAHPAVTIDDDGFFTTEQPNLVGAAAMLFRRTASCNESNNDNDGKDSPRTRSFSLLDDDLASVVTTTPLSPETPSPISSSTLPLCGVVGCWSAPEETTPSSLRAAACMDDGLQEYLYEFLSDPSSGGAGQKSFPWQAMLTSMADDSDDDDDDDNDNDDDDSEQREIKKHRMKILRNRAIHLHARKERLDTLRRDLHPFSGTATPPPATGSSLAIGNGNKIMPRSHSQPISAPTKPRRKPLQDRTHHHHHQPEQVWSSWSCHNIPQSPDALVWEDDDEDCGENGYSCYDSDPEDSLRSRNNYTPPPAPPPAPVKNKRKSAFNNNNNNNIIVVSDDLYAGNNIYDIVHGAFNERWTFILHPESSSQHHGNPCSAAVQAWMERGQRLSTTVIPPKLVYQFIGKSTSSSSKSSSSSSTQQGQQRPRLLGTTTPLYSIDLLEIQRVLEMHRVNRELYPFAKAQSTFTITTLSDTLCFEASSKSERDRIVRLLKLLVARFGSQLVTGDIRVEEFFTMIGNGPGGAHVEYNRLY